VDDFDENIVSFVNSVRTVDGGTHVQGLRSAISKTLAEVGRKRLLKDNNVSSDDFRQGLRAVVAVRYQSLSLKVKPKVNLVPICKEYCRGCSIQGF